MRYYFLLTIDSHFGALLDGDRSREQKNAVQILAAKQRHNVVDCAFLNTINMSCYKSSAIKNVSQMSGIKMSLSL